MRATLLLSALIFSTASLADDLPVVGLADDGSPIEETLPRSELSRRYSGVLEALHESAMPVLSRTDSRSSWKLRTVVIGVGVGLEAGIGPLIKIKAVPRFRLVYSNSKDPVLP